MNPRAGNLARVAGSSCGTGRCVGLIRARGAWTHGVCGCRRRSQGAVVGAGGRALPSPAVLGLSRGHCCCARPQDSLLGLALVMSLLRQCLPAPSLPARCGGTAPGVPVAVGAISHTAHHSSLSTASLELLVAACPALLVLPSWGCVRGLAGGCSCSCLGVGLPELPEPRALSQNPGPCSLCRAMASPSQAGAPGEQQSQQAGNRLWKLRRDATRWAVGHSLEGLDPRMWAHPWAWAALTVEQLGCPCRACGRRQEDPGQHLSPPNLSLCCRQELQPVM